MVVRRCCSRDVNPYHPTGRFTYIGLIFMVIVGRNYSIHGWYGVETCCFFQDLVFGEGDSTCRDYEELSILGRSKKCASMLVLWELAHQNSALFGLMNIY